MMDVEKKFWVIALFQTRWHMHISINQVGQYISAKKREKM